VSLKKLEFDRGCDIHLESLDVPGFGYFFDQQSHGASPLWIRDFSHNLDKTPFPTEVQRELETFKYGMKKPPGKESLWRRGSQPTAATRLHTRHTLSAS
jgi:hypothetical protein